LGVAAELLLGRRAFGDAPDDGDVAAAPARDRDSANREVGR